MERGEPSWQTRFDLADIDAELERRRRNQRLELAPLQAPLGVQPVLLGHAAVVGGDQLLAEPRRELARHPLGHAPRVDEDERGAVLLDQPGEALVDLLPHLRRHHRLQGRRRNLEGQIPRAAVADVDDGAVRGRRAFGTGADQEAGHGVDRLLRGGEADAQQPVAAQRGEALQRQRQMRAALVGRQGVDLVHDDGARGLEHGAAGLGAQQDVERLRGRHHDVRRGASRAVALGLRRVARAHPGADVDVGEALLAQRRADSRQRRLQVALDVVGERLERGDVDDLRLVLEPALQALPHQRIDGRQEGRKRLAGARRRRDQHVPARLDRRPSLRLRRRGCGEVLGKPRGDRRMKLGGRAHGAVVGLGRRLGHRPRHDRAVARKARGAPAACGSSPRLLDSDGHVGAVGCEINSRSVDGLPGNHRSLSPFCS